MDDEIADTTLASKTMDPEFSILESDCRNAFDELWELPLEEFKKAWKEAPVSLPSGTPSLEQIEVSYRDVSISDGSVIQIQIYRPKELAEKLLPLFYVMHGGGWVVGGHNVEEGVNRHVCLSAECIVISVDYRMAPEFPYPFALDDSFEVLQWCLRNSTELRLEPQLVIVGGGSAGGNLAAAVALRARDQGLKGIVGQLLNIPVTCHPQLWPKDLPSKSWDENKDAPIVDAQRMLWFWDKYMPELDSSPMASPLLSKSFHGLPPALIQVAGMDPLRDEGLAYANALRSAGIAVSVNMYDGLPHGFYMFPQLSKTQQYYEASAMWVKDLLQAIVLK